jgi:steroid delta-isomerase-like uncharacterized protein
VVAPRPDDPRALVRRLHTEVFAARDLDVLDEFFAPDFVSHNQRPDMPAGVEGVKEFFALFRDALSDLAVSVDEIVCEGEWAAIATTTTGTHTGELSGIAPTGRTVSVTGIDLVRVANGRIVEHRGLTDTVGLVRQLAG